MSAGVLRYTVVRVNPDNLQAVALLAGRPVPDWAADLVHAEDLVDGDADEVKPYSKWKKGDLEDEVARRNEGRGVEDLIEVDGKGTVADLAAALDADDAVKA